jgi:hypothetical protein
MAKGNEGTDRNEIQEKIRNSHLIPPSQAIRGARDFVSCPDFRVGCVAARTGISQEYVKIMQERKKVAELDFSLLPNLGAAPLWMTIDWLSPNDAMKNPLTKLQETYDRANAAVRFCWFVGTTAERLCCTEDNTAKTREAFLRAALSEFAAMEETLKRDLASRGIKGGCVKITDSRNPLLHIVKQLRNLEVHLHSATLTSEKKRTLLVGHTENPVQDYSLETWMMDDITPEEFDSLRGAKCYRGIDKTRMIRWFNKAQKIWGVAEIVYRAVLFFGKELIERYSLA